MPTPVDSVRPAKREGDFRPSEKPLDSDAAPVLTDSRGLPLAENPPGPRRVVRFG